MSNKNPTPETNGKRIAAGMVLAAILLLTALVYARTASYSLLTGDDMSIVLDQPMVMQGLTLNGVIWALTHTHFALWMPVTSVSHMLDVSLFGRWWGGHHLSNIAWHLAAVLAFFFTVRTLAGRSDLAVIAAALFALHPLRVESVAWVAGRKDLVAGFFFALAVTAHAVYAEKPGVLRCACVLLLGTLAMMGKTSASVLPGVLLLLDVFALGRMGNPGESLRVRSYRAAMLAVEKIPLAVLAVIVIVLAWYGQKSLGLLAAPADHPVWSGIASASGSYLKYLGNFFLPTSLCSPYIEDYTTSPLWVVAFKTFAVFALCMGALLVAGRTPWVTVGWFWFVGALVPVIGVVKFGISPYADRFTYIPSMGLCLALAWILVNIPFRRSLRWAACCILITAMTVLSYGQVPAWKDTWSLFKQKFRVYPDHDPSYTKAGEWLLEQGKVDESVWCYREAVRICPDSAKYCYNLGTALLGKDPSEAVQWLEKAVRLDPKDDAALTNLGCALVNLGRPQEAVTHLTNAVRLLPDNVSAHINLGVALMRTGQKEEARAELEKALAIEPDNAAAKANLFLLK